MESEPASTDVKNYGQTADTMSATGCFDSLVRHPKDHPNINTATDGLQPGQFFNRLPLKRRSAQ
jgi:hypothetical protein